MRNEAIACLALPDARYRALESPVDPYWVAFDPQFEPCASMMRRMSSWMVSDGELLFRLPRVIPQPSWFDLQFSPDGKMLAAGYRSLPQGTRVYDITGKEPVLKLAVAAARDFAFSPKSDMLLAGATDGSIAFHDLATGKEIRRIGDKTNAWNIAVPAAGGKIAVRGHNNQALVLDMDSGAVLAKFDHPAALPTSTPLAWRPDGKLLAVACNDQRIHIWDTVNWREQAVLEGNEGLDVRVWFSPRGDFVISTSWDGMTRLWDPISGQHRLTLQGSFVAIDAGARQLAIYGGARQRGLGIWEFAAGDEFRTLHNGNVGNRTPHPPVTGPTSVNFDPSDRLLATADFDGVRIWDMAYPLDAITHFEGTSLGSARFSPAGGDLLVHSEKGLQRWPLVINQESREVRIGPPVPLDVSGQSSHNRSTWAGAGRRLAATVATQGRAIVLDRENEEFVPRISVPIRRDTNEISLHSSGRFLAVGTWSPQRVELWNLDSGKRVGPLPAGTFHPSFGPSGTWLVAVARNEYQLYRAESWEPGPVIEAERGAWAAAFMHNDELLAVTDGQTVRLIEVRTSQEIATLESSSPNRLTELCFSPAGDRLAVATASHKTQLWDLRALRRQLKDLGLDWNSPPYPPRTLSTLERPLQARVVGLETDSIPDSPNRDLARWIFRNGGDIDVAPGTPTLQNLADLPEEAFDISMIRVDNASISDADLTRFLLLDKLITLWISGTSITDEGLVHIAKIKGLYWLGLDDCPITDAGLAHLAGMQNLGQLQLAKSRITDEGLVHLATLPNLRALSINENAITDAGLLHLYSIQTLRYLELSHTQVSSAGIEELQRHLPKVQIHADSAIGQRGQVPTEL
ncbi:MAG: hypothetical protein WKF77_20635 [Planctomycetaceae bacterium]